MAKRSGENFTFDPLASRIADMREHSLVSTAPLFDLLDELQNDIFGQRKYNPGADIASTLEVVRSRLLSQLEAGVEDGRWLTTGEAKELVGVSEETIRNWCRSNQVRHRKNASGHYLVDRSSVFEMRSPDAA